MKNKKWYKNINEQGIACNWNDLIVIAKRYENGYLHGDYFQYVLKDEMYPITAQEWWALAPWDYDMDSAPKDGSLSSLLDNEGYISIGYYHGVIDVWHSGSGRINDVVAWLPLPDNRINDEYKNN